LLVFAPKTIALTPSDDVWVYEHASDPAHDAYLRVWGNAGNAVAETPGDTGQFSYGLLRWNLDALPAGAKIVDAKLMLKQVSGAGYTVEEAKANPLEAREMTGEFTEKEWAFEQGAKTYPIKGKDAVFGSGYPTKIESADLPITIDLMGKKTPFAKDVAAALAGSKTLYMALTSTIDPSASGRTAVYKVFSKDAETAANRPTLVLTYEAE
jgi:hypothetical protein